MKIITTVIALLLAVATVNAQGNMKENYWCPLKPEQCDQN